MQLNSSAVSRGSFREITDKAIRRGVFPCVPDSIAAVEDWPRGNTRALSARLDTPGRCYSSRWRPAKYINGSLSSSI